MVTDGRDDSPGLPRGAEGKRQPWLPIDPWKSIVTAIYSSSRSSNILFPQFCSTFYAVFHRSEIRGIYISAAINLAGASYSFLPVFFSPRKHAKSIGCIKICYSIKDWVDRDYIISSPLCANEFANSRCACNSFYVLNNAFLETAFGRDARASTAQ